MWWPPFQSTRPLRGATRLSPSRRRSQSISIHAPLAGRDGFRGCVGHRDTDFNPRAPCGARRVLPSSCTLQCHFNPRAPCGARLWTFSSADRPLGFQSTRPLRGATPRRCRPPTPAAGFQSTRPLRGATESCYAANLRLPISIHAPLAGRDGRLQAVRVLVLISIHAPLAGRDRRFRFARFCQENFNPRAPCGARPSR